MPHWALSHRMTGTPTYSSWAGMVQRCTNPKTFAWERYGGRGIRVCKRWLKFSNFFADMGERPAGTTLDRKNANWHYQRRNCRWISKRDQQRNRTDNLTYTFKGITLPVKTWAEKTGISFETLRQRRRNGWPAKLALTVEVSKSNSILRSAKTRRRNALGKFQ